MRPSAGTSSPAAMRTTSPTTTSSDATTASVPSRRTRAVASIICWRAFMALSALPCWRSPPTALNSEMSEQDDRGAPLRDDERHDRGADQDELHVARVLAEEAPQARGRLLDRQGVRSVAGEACSRLARGESHLEVDAEAGRNRRGVERIPPCALVPLSVLASVTDLIDPARSRHPRRTFRPQSTTLRAPPTLACPNIQAGTVSRGRMATPCHGADSVRTVPAPSRIDRREDAWCERRCTGQPRPNGEDGRGRRMTEAARAGRRPDRSTVGRQPRACFFGVVAPASADGGGADRPREGRSGERAEVEPPRLRAGAGSLGAGRPPRGAGGEPGPRAVAHPLRADAGSPFTFYRGAAPSWPRDLALPPVPASPSSSVATPTCRTSDCSGRPSGG